jgi:hypothetical protein
MPHTPAAANKTEAYPSSLCNGACMRGIADVEQRHCECTRSKLYE